MWSAEYRNYLYRNIFEEFHAHLGTSLTENQLFDINVNIIDVEGYEKLRNLIVEFLDSLSRVYYQTTLGYSGLREFDAAMDLFKSFVRTVNNLSGQNLQLYGSNVGELFRQLIEYEKPHDISDIGNIQRLKKLSNSNASVFTIREIFNFMHFEFKAYWSVEYGTSDNTYIELIKAVFSVFDYSAKDARGVDRMLVRKIVNRWDEETESGLLRYPYQEFRDFMKEVTAKGKASKSSLLSIFRTIMNVVYWITEEKRFTNRERAINYFAGYLQYLSK